MLRIVAALQGDLRKVMATELQTAVQAVSQGVQQATDGLKGELRNQVTNAGLGGKLAQTWRGQIYPRGGQSINAAGYIYSKAPDIISSFAEGVTIRSKHGRFLAIPTQYVIRQKNRRISPADFEEAGIPLRYIPPQGARRVGLLVADNFHVTSKGRARVASATALRTGRGLASIIMFVLVPQVSLKKRLDVDGAAQKWIDKLPELVVAAWPEDKENS